MEFTNEIFFNKKLTQNETVLITYSGKLYKEYSAEITIVYGFGENWDYTQETKMQEKENGFEAAITMKNYDTFNFCFKNNYNIWDNNSGFNYIATIEPAKVEDTTKEEQSVKIEEKTKEESTIKPELNEELTENKNIETTNIAENNENPVNDETKKQALIEEAFDNLLNSIMDIKEDDINKNVNLENGFGLQSVDEIKETDFTSCDDIFNDLYNELTKTEPTSESNVQNISTEDTQENKQKNIQTASTEENKEDTTQLETLLSDFSEKQEKKKQLITSEELDELMNNILNSIIEEDSKQENVQVSNTEGSSKEENSQTANAEENTNKENIQTVNVEESSKEENIQTANSEEESKQENIKKTSTKNNFKLETEIYGLPAKKQSSFEDMIDKCIDGTYNFFKNIWKGCKKVGVLIKQKTRELIGEEDK